MHVKLYTEDGHEAAEDDGCDFVDIADVVKTLAYRLAPVHFCNTPTITIICI